MYSLIDVLAFRVACQAPGKLSNINYNVSVLTEQNISKGYVFCLLVPL